jgi:hypothetical protein
MPKSSGRSSLLRQQEPAGAAAGLEAAQHAVARDAAAAVDQLARGGAHGRLDELGAFTRPETP